jgi:hypothetical protein
MTGKYSEKTTISAKFWQEHIRTTKSESTQRISELETLAAGYAEPRQIFPGGVVPATLLLLTGLAFTGIVAFLLWERAWKGNIEFVVMVLGGVLYSLVTILMVRYFLRLKKPLLHLGPDGVELLDGAITLPWTAIMRYEVFLHYTSGIFPLTTTLTLFLHADVPIPKLSFDLWLRYSKKHHTITLKTIKFAGLSSDALDDLFGKYLRAGHARAKLRDLMQ